VIAQPTTIPWTPRDVWLGIASFAIWIVLFGLLRLVVDFFSLTLDAGLLVSLGELLLLLPVWWLTVRKYGIAWQALGLRSFAITTAGIGCGLMLMSFTFNFIYGSLLAFFGLRMQVDLVPIFEELASPWLLLLGGAIIAPFVEEVFFRGFVFAGLRPRYGWQKAAVISSAIFAGLHLTPTAIIPIFILGYIFAYLYHLSNSIWPAILMHILTNTLALGAAYLVATGQIDLAGLGLVAWF
jgi:membrane protease YdiL (CAAX protease family)